MFIFRYSEKTEKITKTTEEEEKWAKVKIYCRTYRSTR